MKVLFINSSPKDHGSTSSKIAKILIDCIEKKIATTVTIRNLFSPAIEHIDADFIGSAYRPLDHKTIADADVLKISDELISEIKEADNVVIGTPFWNFSMPSVLKAYMDNIARVGVTFKYTDKGPVGLIEGGKKIAICIASGGVYSSSDHSVLEANMKIFETFFKFIGFTSVDFITLEGVARGDDALKSGLAKAEQKADEVAAKWMNG